MKKCSWLTFGSLPDLQYFTKCTLIVTELIAKISYIAIYVLFITRAAVKYISIKTCVAIYNSFTNSVFRLTRLFEILRNLVAFSITLASFRFIGIFVINFCSHEIILKSANFTPANHGRLLPQNSFVFLIRHKSICASFKTFLESLSNGWYI